MPRLDDARNRYVRLRASELDDGPLVLFMVLDALVNTFESVLPLLAAQLDRLETAILEDRPRPSTCNSFSRSARSSRRS